MLVIRKKIIIIIIIMFVKKIRKTMVNAIITSRKVGEVFIEAPMLF
jgi:hypothetical protein